MKATCPKDPRHKRFVTVVNAVQEVAVTSNGTILQSLEVIDHTSNPDSRNVWKCWQCGTRAVIKNGRKHTRESAAALIEREDPRWFDFCSERGHLHGNVNRLHAVQDDFRDYLNEES